MPIAKDTKQPKGYAYILFLLPEHAVNAYKDLDMKEFQGRLLHILPAKEKPAPKEEEIYGINGSKLSAVKKDKEQKRKNLAGNDFNWNSLFMSVSQKKKKEEKRRQCTHIQPSLERCHCRIYC